MRQKTNFKAYFYLLAASLFWGSSFVALKYALSAYTPFQVIFGRMLIGSLCFLPILHKILPKTLDLKNITYLVVLSLCEPCLYFIFEGYALRFTSPSQASIIVSTLPIMVGIAAYYVFKEKISFYMWFGFFLSVAGIALLTFGGTSNYLAPSPVLGNFLEFMAMVMAVGYVLLLKRLTFDFHPFFIAFFQSLIGTIFFFALILIFNQKSLKVEAGPLGAVIYLGIFVTFLAYSCYNSGVKLINVSRASIFVNLIPVFSVILSFLFFKEIPTFWQITGMILVLVGVFLSQKS